jgi:hypothetical protein
MAESGAVRRSGGTMNTERNARFHFDEIAMPTAGDGVNLCRLAE